MIEVTIEGEPTAVESLRSAPKKVRRAARMALNRVASQTKTQMAREAAKEYIIKVGDVKKTITLTKSDDSLLATLKSKGRLISLSKFKVTPLKVQHRGRRNRKIKVQVKRNSTKAVLDRAFVAQLGSSLSVAERIGKARYPLKKAFGPSVPQMINNEGVMRTIQADSQKKLDAEVNRQIARLLKR